MANEIVLRSDQWKRVAMEPRSLAQIQSSGLDERGAIRLVRQVADMIRKRSDLQDCTDNSLLSCVRDCAEMGLEPVLGQVDLIPYKNVCTLSIGYKGLIELARRSKDVMDVEVRAVRAKDEFRMVYGTNPSVTHIPDVTDTSDPVYYYCILKFRDGSFHADGMSREEVENVRKSYAKSATAWSKSFDEMAKKTILRRAAKMWPLSIMDKRLTDAFMTVDSEFNVGGFHSEGAITHVVSEPEQSATERLKTTLLGEKTIEAKTQETK